MTLKCPDLTRKSKIKKEKKKVVFHDYIDPKYFTKHMKYNWRTHWIQKEGEVAIYIKQTADPFQEDGVKF